MHSLQFWPIPRLFPFCFYCQQTSTPDEPDDGSPVKNKNDVKLEGSVRMNSWAAVDGGGSRWTSMDTRLTAVKNYEGLDGWGAEKESRNPQAIWASYHDVKVKCRAGGRAKVTGSVEAGRVSPGEALESDMMWELLSETCGGNLYRMLGCMKGYYRA